MGYFLILILLFVPSVNSQSLQIYTWNLEHLAQKNGEGCKPRDAKAFDDLAMFAASFNADIIAVQEVENETALHRIFPASNWHVELSSRPANSDPIRCRGSDNTLTEQRVGFAIRKGVDYQRIEDVVTLSTNERLRRGVEIELSNSNKNIHMLALHLKSGCFSGRLDASNKCRILETQLGHLEDWIDEHARHSNPFIILGDFNRRINDDSDVFFEALNDGDPNDYASLVRITKGLKSCHPNFKELIDHVITDSHTSAQLNNPRVKSFNGEMLSDHCPVGVTLAGETTPVVPSPPTSPIVTPIPTGKLHPSPPQGLVGSALRTWLKEHHYDGKHRELGYSLARRLMYRDIDATNGRVIGVYSGFSQPAKDTTFLNPINAEHSIPQSWFSKREPMRGDIHHLFPTHKYVNSRRSNLVFSDIDDATTELWLGTSNAGKLIESRSPPQDKIAHFSELIKSKYFEPPEAHKGNLARAIAYFYTMYPNQAGHLSRIFKNGNIRLLSQWHSQDPVDDKERARNIKIKQHQGNANPYIIDETLLCNAWQVDGC